MDMSALAGLAKPSENVSEKIQKSLSEKDTGSKYFKEGDLKKASFHYHTSLNYVNGLVGLNPEQTASVNDIKVAVNNNLAFINLKEKKYKRVIDCTSKVLQIDSNNVKALFRRGKAYLEQGDLDRAQLDLTKANQLDPNDSAIKKEITVLNQKNKEAEKKSQKFYSNMFDKMSKEESDVTSKTSEN